MNHSDLDTMRKQLDELNHQLLDLLSRRAEIVQKIGHEKQRQGLPRFDPVRESMMLEDLVSRNQGPFDNTTVRYLFKQIFKASLDLLGEEQKKHLLVTRKQKPEDTVVRVKQVEIGGPSPVLFAGPCTIESYEQMRRIANQLQSKGISVLRGGAFKSRTSPYDFQGLGIEGIQILHQVGSEFGMVTVSEVMDVGDLGSIVDSIDIIEIGAKNMQNFSLLKAVGQLNKPVLLKRGPSATLEELLLSAEYIVSCGNDQVILMERGIRTYEKWTQNTLDISSVPILKKESHLPVLVDVSHSTGRKDIVTPCAKAALAAGADGIMVEIHPDPSIAMSDALQQLNFDEFHDFIEQLRVSGLYRPHTKM